MRSAHPSLIDTNCWGANGSAVIGDAQHENPIYEDPWFVQSDWHLATGDSVCQDAGLTLNDVPDDYDGDQRYQGDGYDVGADEVAVGVAGGSRLVSMQAARPRGASGRVAGTRLYGAQPNPFNPATTISFDLAESGRVELSILNIQGAVVRRLVDESLTSGPHQVVWEGRDNRGQAAGSGIYLIQLRTATETFQSKALLLK